ncbi:Yqey-like protein-domain-containing protein [Neohortaea acidophila]|uniref:Altered inheritance of mitochondria protein 41 n=1 Tax=Neohortaea acidophila TaxID=245834 RepID=A0A6A6PYX2_9PEZI|nr:Yqey-like protein-domain-containing protein [Neohortaea acidophila]KAF2484966.1 Yqey-like protein-domain-containing protein [Neohortaea acidophila]
MAFSIRATGLASRNLSRLRYICPQCRGYADVSAPPPLLIKLRKDLKTAMQNKDTNRLNVLRSLIADVTNAAKTSSPIKTDMQILSLLRKRQAAAKQASEEFKAAGRQDLVEKEQGQVGVLEEYAGSVETISADDIREVVIRVVNDSKEQRPDGQANIGEVLKKLLGAGGSLDGKPVDRKEVSRIVKEVLTMS